MKKAFLLLFALSSFLLGCDNDDVEEDNSIIGTWKLSQVVITEVNNQNVNLNVIELIDLDDEIVFYENGTYKTSDNYISNWEIINNGQSLKLTDSNPDSQDEDSDNSTIIRFQLNNNQLTYFTSKLTLHDKDRDPKEGIISYSAFEKEFNISLGEEDDIYVSAELIFKRQ